jgi:hypothetical protein
MSSKAINQNTVVSILQAILFLDLPEGSGAGDEPAGMLSTWNSSGKK